MYCVFHTSADNEAAFYPCETLTEAEAIARDSLEAGGGEAEILMRMRTLWAEDQGSPTNLDRYNGVVRGRNYPVTL